MCSTIAWPITVAECARRKLQRSLPSGSGIGDSARLELVAELASALGGSVGCSRPLVDLAWLPHARQIGVSGHTIRPKVYLACGISGAAQHLAGIGEAQTVIAINGVLLVIVALYFLARSPEVRQA